MKTSKIEHLQFEYIQNAWASKKYLIFLSRHVFGPYEGRNFEIRAFLSIDMAFLFGYNNLVH